MMTHLKKTSIVLCVEFIGSFICDLFVFRSARVILLSDSTITVDEMVQVFVVHLAKEGVLNIIDNLPFLSIVHMLLLLLLLL